MSVNGEGKKQQICLKIGFIKVHSAMLETPQPYLCNGKFMSHVLHNYCVCGEKKLGSLHFVKQYFKYHACEKYFVGK